MKRSPLGLVKYVKPNAAPKTFSAQVLKAGKVLGGKASSIFAVLIWCMYIP